jgi:MFS family permease
VVQGVGAAAMTPTSLAIVDSSFCDEDRSAAVGAWASGTAVATAGGPFLGGLLVDALSWRWVFVLGLPLAGASMLATVAHVPASGASTSTRRLDVAGSLLSSVALVGVVYALVQGPATGWSDASVVTALLVGLGAAIGFVVREARVPDPLLPLRVFASEQFSGANVVTLLVYFALSGVFFFTALAFQTGLGYDASAAGAALVPSNVVMIAASPSVGRFAGRHGPRLPVAVGALVTGASFVMLALLDEDSSYVTTILPASLVLGAGLAVLVPPLTSSVLGAVGQDNVGLASAVNNAVARTGGLLATAMLPGLAGVTGTITLDGGYERALMISAALCALAALVGYATVGRGVSTHTSQAPSVLAGCAQVSVPVATRAGPAR